MEHYCPLILSSMCNTVLAHLPKCNCHVPLYDRNTLAHYGLLNCCPWKLLAAANHAMLAQPDETEFRFSFQARVECVLELGATGL